MKLISITGPDGSGKSTQAKLLAASLPGSRIVSVWDVIKRPEFKPERIYLSSPKVEEYVTDLHPFSRSLFIFHAFNEAYEKALTSSAKYLIFDGYWYKYWAVEKAMGAPALLEDVLKEQYRTPDYNFYIDLPVGHILKRKKQYSVYETAKAKDKMNAFMKIQTEVIEILRRLMPKNTLRLDGSQMPEVIHQQISHIINAS